MRNSAKIELIGYVYGEVENPMPDQYQNMVKFSLSVTDKWKDKNGEQQKAISWYKCQSWTQGISKIIQDHVKGGMGLMVRGTPKTRAYIDKDGVAKSQIEVNVSEINILTYPKDKEEYSKVSTATTASPVEDDPFNDDIPF